jgi:hypothetical protein
VKGALLLLAVLLPSSLFAQGLGDSAARERQKRAGKGSAPPAKVYTEKDLPQPAAPADASQPGEATSHPVAPKDNPVIPRDSGVPSPEESAAPADPSSPGPEGAPRADGEAPVDPYEKERQERKLLEAEWRVRFANAREQLAIAEANSWQEVVRTEFYQGIPVQMKVKEQVQTNELKQARQALADLNEEFRRTGLPPGWARE